MLVGASDNSSAKTCSSHCHSYLQCARILERGVGYSNDDESEPDHEFY